MLRASFLVVLYSLIPGYICAQSGVSGVIQGRVTDTETGIGIAGASVHLIPRDAGNRTGNQIATTTSSEDGSFRFDSVAPGTYAMWAKHSNYVNLGKRSQFVSVNGGRQPADVGFRLSPPGTISGRVLDDAGLPAPEARIELFSTFNRRGRAQVRRMQSTASNARGEYVFKRVMPGKYFVAADRPDHSAPPGSTNATPTTAQVQNTPSGPELSNIHPVRTFYSSALHLESASSIEIASGASMANADIRLQRAATFHVRGRVEAALPGALQKGARLILAPRDTPAHGGLGSGSAAQADGSFDIDGMQDGSYTLWLLGSYATAPDQNPRANRRRLLARQDIDVNGSDVNGVSIPLMPPVNLAGRITLENAPANVNFAQMRVNLQVAEQTGFGAFQSLPVDAEGAFAVQDLEPGEYMVRVVNVPAGMYVQSITLNRQDVAQSGLDVSQGGGGELEVVLRTGVAQVGGTLEGGAAGSGAAGVVLLAPEALAADGSGLLFGAIKAPGTFAIGNVPPGRYVAFAVERWTSVWQNPDFVREMQRDGEPVDVQPNGHAQIQLPLLTLEQLQPAASRLGLEVQ